MPTPHNEAQIDEIAKTVIMPGDPLRAKYIVENFFDDYKLVNQVRGMYAYTGTYKGHELSVMAHGMGMPSVGIYSYELYKFYEVDKIIRVGSCGAYTDKLKLYDIVLAKDAFSESTYAKTMGMTNRKFLTATKSLNNRILKAADGLGMVVNVATVHSSDVFYRLNADEYKDIYEKHNAVAVEMESYALFANAKALNKKAACLLTVSDNLVTKEATTALERQTAFTKMMLIALNSI